MALVAAHPNPHPAPLVDSGTGCHFPAGAAMQQFTSLSAGAALRRHWPYYLAEALGLGAFVVFSCLTAVFFNHPAAWGRQWLGESEWLRRAGTGLVMALVLAAVSYNRWGQRSGAHINPAVTVGFWQAGSMRGVDAAWYVAWQFAGALGFGYLMLALLHPWYPHPDVHYNLTKPGPGGWAAAFTAEFVISGVLMGVLLVALHSPRLKKVAGWLVAGLVWLYIIFETPLSGMSLNPGRSLGTAVAAGQYPALWVYFVAPVAAMWLAAVLFRRFHRSEPLASAVVAGADAAPTQGPFAREPVQHPDPVADKR